MRRRTTAEMDELVRQPASRSSRWRSIAGACSASRSRGASPRKEQPCGRNSSTGLPPPSACRFSFLVVYGGCNWITAQRHDVGTIFFEWERLIPFVPLMIVPYMSIDLFFVAGAVSLPEQSRAGDLHETHRRGHPRRGNLLPSLSAPLRFRASARRRLAGRALRLVSRNGSALNFASVASHRLAHHPRRHLCAAHAGSSCAWRQILWFRSHRAFRRPDLSASRHGRGRRFRARRHTLLLRSFARHRHALPVSQIGAVDWYYGSSGDHVVDYGRISFGHGECFFFGQRIVRYRGDCILQSRSDSFSKGGTESLPGATVWWAPASTRVNISRCCITGADADRGTRSHRKSGLVASWGARSANKALCSGVVSVLDLTAEFSEVKPFRKINYRNIPVMDLTAPTQEQLVEMSKFIGNHSGNGAVYVHCKIGYSRSAAAVAAYLIMGGKVKTAEEAFAIIRRVRPSVVIRPEVCSALSEFQQRVRSSPSGTDSFFLALDHGALS